MAKMKKEATGEDVEVGSAAPKRAANASSAKRLCDPARGIAPHARRAARPYGNHFIIDE
jgi:hypothetical protein